MGNTLNNSHLNYIYMDDNSIDRTITNCIAAGLGSILICSFVIPIVSSMLKMITQKGSDGKYIFTGDVGTWETLIGLVVVMTIIGLVIALVRGFSLRSER